IHEETEPLMSAPLIQDQQYFSYQQQQFGARNDNYYGNHPTANATVSPNSREQEDSGSISSRSSTSSMTRSSSEDSLGSSSASSTISRTSASKYNSDSPTPLEFTTSTAATEPIPVNFYVHPQGAC